MGVLRKAIFVKFVDLEKKVVVDFRSRMLAFRGAGGEPPRQASGVSPVQLFPQESSILPLQSTF
ncbi:hypothetical protein [Rossellomorea sp. NRS-1567]|uniref:hypothetical protein n=1 Tax=Rossellomorea sp. NRS-1567 TaxID=3233901 RepID=UPI003D298F51